MAGKLIYFCLSDHLKSSILRAFIIIDYIIRSYIYVKSVTQKLIATFL